MMQQPTQDAGTRHVYGGISLIRIVFLALAGLVMIAVSLNGTVGNGQGWAAKNLGPHGEMLSGVSIGALFLLLGIFLAARAWRHMRAVSTANAGQRP